MSVRTVTLSTFPHGAGCTCGYCADDPEACYWQVNVNGQPVTHELRSQPHAVAAFNRTVRDMSTHGRKVRRMFWDGYNQQETPLS